MRKTAFASYAYASRLFCLGIAFAISLAGCGGGTGGSVQPPPQKTTQTITFAQPTSPVVYASGLTVPLSATATSGLTITFTVDATSTGKGTVSGSTLTVTTVGNIVVDANQAGNGSYDAASQVQKTVVVNQATPTVSVWPIASAITSGQALSASTLTGGTPSVAGAFAWTTSSTVPAVGTDSESVTFTPTDATDYTTVIGSVPVVANPTTPQITALTPRYAVADDTTATVNHTITCIGCLQGDLIHDATGIFPEDLSWTSSTATQTFFDLWQEGDFQPTWDALEIQYSSAAYGNQWSWAFLGSASQSTLVVSPTNGTLFQDEQKDGQIHWQKTDGTTGVFFSGPNVSPTLVAVDDAGNVVRVVTGTSTQSPFISVYDESGDGGVSLCQVTPTGMSFISSIAARGGYMVLTDPTDNLIGSAKMDCTGYQTISVVGQPWSVAMVNTGTETDAYVLFRDAWATDGKPGVVKFVAPAMTIAGSVELAIPTISDIRATTPQEGVRQIVAVTNTQVAVLSMSNSSDGEVLLVSTDTSNKKAMAVTNTVSVPELPFALATQQTTSASTLWVAYINALGGDNVTHTGTINPSTGDYTPAVGTCPVGILAGGFAASATQVYCAQGSVIDPLQQ